MIRFRRKDFSVKAINKSDLFNIFGKSISSGIGAGFFTGSPKTGGTFAIMSLLLNSMEKLSNDEAARLGMPTKRANFGNPYLLNTLRRLRYIENFDFMTEEKTAEVNISLFMGRFIITAPKNSDAVKKIDKGLWSSFKTSMTKTDTGQVIIYSYIISSRSEFDLVLKKLMALKLKPNIFEK